MTPNSNHEFEARLTALLLGELSAGEEAVVREAIAKDPALAQLHARLQQTIGLVREAARSVAEETASPSPALQLSKERRDKMLRSFKVIKPQPSAWARWRKVSMRDVSSVAAMIVVLGLLAWGLFGDTLAKGKHPQRTTAIPGIRAVTDAVLAYGRRSSATSSRGELLESLGEREVALHDALIVANPPQPAAPEGVANGGVAALGITPTRHVVVTDGRAGGRSSFARPAQPTVHLDASVPAAFTPSPPAEVAQRGSQRVILPALTDPSPALRDDLAAVNLWAENQPSAAPLGDIRDLQRGREQVRAGVVAGTALVREPLSADGGVTTAYSDSTPQPQSLALNSTATFGGGLNNTTGGFGGGGSGGDANARGWFSQTTAQQNNSFRSLSAPFESGIQANRSGDEARRSVALASAAPATPPPAGIVQDNFYFSGRVSRFDSSVTKGAEVRFGSQQADDFVATTPVDASSVVVAREVMAAPIPAPATAMPQKPQSAQSRVGLGRVVAENEAVQSYDLDSPSEYSEAQLAAKSQGMNGADGSKLNTELAISGRISGFQPLNESKVERKNGVQVENEVLRQSLTRSVDQPVRSEALARFKAIDNLEDKSGDKELAGASVQNGQRFLEKGRLDEAEIQLREAIKQDPNDKAANDYLKLLQDKRNRNAITRRADSNNERLVKVEEAWNPPNNRALTETDGDGLAAGKPVAPTVVPPFTQLPTSGGLISQEVVGFGNITNGPSDLGLVLKNASQSARGLRIAPTSDEAPKEAKPALQTSELRSYRARILLPEGRDSEQKLKRESQVQTGPVSTSEIEVREQIKPLEKLSKLADDEFVKRPALIAPISQPEVATLENAFSTFSLNVSDVSFKLAAAALEKGQMPDPATVRSEEFINAFDYRDQEPAGSAPIAFAWERARYPFAHDRDLVRFSVKTAASGRQPGRPLNLVLLLDNSGSMERADRIRIRQECLRVLAGQLQPQDRVSVVAFARTARLWVDGLPGNQSGELPQRVGGLTPEGGTNLEDAMNLAYQTARRHFLAGGVNRVVLLTDGAANLGDVQPESLKKKVEANRQQGIALDCFGIGWEGYNDDLLETLSRNGDGRYGFVNTPEAATTEFASQLAGALKVAASDVKVQVEWNPRRVTAYRQIGYAKHQLKKEQFRDNTVDAAEIGAAEAGNALYTVQVNPAGEGPLGAMRVRFKVPGTSDYREHEWPLPYEGAAKSLDQSSATLRLAASASAFSEWLVSSPFAAEVTPDKLLSYLSNVPETFSTDPRPKKLEWMIRQAKSVSGK